MTYSPLVSIITPCYNAERYIDDCVLSVIGQTYKNWELLLIDDCSSDGTFQKILYYSTADPRIKPFQTKQPSGSPSHPRNIGITHARGEFIAFLDADDLWLPNKLKEQLHFINKNNFVFVYSNYEKISLDGTRRGRVVTMAQKVSYDLIIKSCEIPCSTVLIKSDLIKHRLFRQVGKEDYLLWIQILKKGVSAYNCGVVHTLYRESNTSRSGNKIRMVYQQWIILRDFEKVSLFKTLNCLLYYMARGLFKYLK